MTHDLNDNCATCKFWTGDKKRKEGDGQCHRYPPKPAGVIPRAGLSGKVEPAVISAFPSCAASAWCGEFVQDNFIEMTH